MACVRKLLHEAARIQCPRASTGNWAGPVGEEHAQKVTRLIGHKGAARRAPQRLLQLWLQQLRLPCSWMLVLVLARLP